MNTQKKLAIPVDFSETSRHAFSESIFLAKRANLEVVIIHINSDRSKTEADFHNLITEMIAEEGETAADVTISWRIIPGEKGAIVDQIARTIDQIDPKYVMVGYELKRGLDRFVGPSLVKILAATTYPVIALKLGETVRELTTLIFPLTLDAFSRQKTNASIRFVKYMGLHFKLLPLRINNTRKDNVHQDIITKNLVKKLTEQEVSFDVEWEEGSDEVEILLSKTQEDNSGILAVVFESSPEFIDNFRTTREEKLMQTTQDPLLIVKSHHSPFMH
jgi:hypothetical protein